MQNLLNIIYVTNLATACLAFSDGVVRIFTSNPERVATENILKVKELVIYNFLIAINSALCCSCQGRYIIINHYCFPLKGI